MDPLQDLLTAIENTPVLVVGDLMLDRFVYGDVDRISPESPVPVLSIGKENIMLGGAGNVLTNLAALGARPFIFAVVGADEAAAQVRDLIAGLKADGAGIKTDASRPTTIKTRYLARGQQLLRTDSEKTHALPESLEQALWLDVQSCLPRMKAVVLSDYGKGILSKNLIEKIIGAAKQSGIPVLVDPKGSDYTIYRGADIVTPNRKELAEASARKNLRSDDEIVSAAKSVLAACGIGAVVATRSEDGVSVITDKNAAHHFPAQAREVYDVSGAGDTVIAALAAALACGADVAAAAQLANMAGGIAVSKIGTSPVRVDELRDALQGRPFNADASPIADWSAAGVQAQRWKKAGLKVGFTNGCFDILHAGHVGYLAQARKLCDRLIIGLNSDSSVRLLKGSSRPVNGEAARAAVLAALGSVDLVVPFGAENSDEDNTPAALIQTLQPDIFFKGGDYTKAQLPEAKIVESYGGEVSIMGMKEGFSTTGIIARSQKSA